MPTLALAPIHNHLARSEYVMAYGSVGLPLTGTTAETALARVSLTPAQMGPNGVLTITAAWSYTNNANAKTPRVRFGAAGITPPAGGLITGQARTTQLFEQFINLIRNRNNLAKQVANSPTSIGMAVGVFAPVSLFTIDTSAACDLIFTGQLANAADTITLEGYEVELFYGT